jgi:FkbM family methyltransferase
MRELIDREIRQTYANYKAIRGAGSLLCLLDRLLRKEKVRRVNIGDTDIYVRTNTSDLIVAVSCLHDKEYDVIRCSDPKVIIDAGAYIGMSTIFFAEKYPHARIIAVEPGEGNFELLRKNTKRYGNVTAIKAAIWHTNETRAIKHRHTSYWGLTVTDTQNKVEPTGQQIDCITVASLMEAHSIERIDLFKMDIEGGEKNVLENSSDWIDAVEILTVELHDRISEGCTGAFHQATREFAHFETHGEKVTAYRR